MFAIPQIYRYIFREIATPLLVGVGVFTGILFLARSLKLVGLVVNKNVPAGDIILLFSYIVPGFLELAIPMSLLLGIILAFGRLSADSELVVLRSVGLSLKQMAKPVILISFGCALITLLIGFYLRPWANWRLGQGVFQIAKSQAASGLQPSTFNKIGALTIYAEEIEGGGERLSNVVIGDNRDPQQKRTFIAKYGRIVSDPEMRSLKLELIDGSIQEGGSGKFGVTEFRVNGIELPQGELGVETNERGKRTKELYIGELLEKIDSTETSNFDALNKSERRQFIKPRVELQRRLALPVSCVAISLIALSLGIQPSRGGSTWGASMNVAIGIATILIYYLLFAVATALAEQRIEVAWILMWLPNLIFFLGGIYLFRKIGSEAWMAVSEKIAELFSRIARFSPLRRRRKLSELPEVES